MIKLFLKTLLVLFFPNIICASEQFDLRNYHRLDTDPPSYTLALLDRSLIKSYGSLPQRESEEFIKPFIHPAIKMEEKKGFQFSYKKNNGVMPEYYIVKLMRVSHDLKSAMLTDRLLGEPLENEGEFDQESVSEKASEEENGTYVYSASMILIPINDEKEEDKILAYLLGHWSSLINMESVEKFFGLKAVCSLGITAKEDELELTNIKEIVSETHRKTNPMRTTDRPPKELNKVSDFGLDPASIGIESVRLKPIETWGRALVKGDDFFYFKLGNKGKEKSTSGILSLSKIANEIYRIYLTNKIHKDFMPYIDTPVTDKIVIGRLNEQLNAKWTEYIHREEIYMHWSFWFRTKDCEENDLISIKNKIMAGPLYNRVSIGNQEVNISRIIRSLPLLLEQTSPSKNYFRYDRGYWYEILEARFEAIKQQITDITRSHSDFFFPDYEYKKELAYNKAAVEEMRKNKSVSRVTLLDRSLTSLEGKGNKFELADIFLKKEGGDSFFIHVKRAGATDIDHHRSQVERCALFLGEKLDRSAALKSFIQEQIEEFYKEHIPTPPQTKSNYFKTKYKKAIEQPKENDFLSILSSGRPMPELKSLIQHEEIKPLIDEFVPYGDILFRCFDVFKDWLTVSKKTKLSSEEEDNKLLVIKEFLSLILQELSEYSDLVGSNGLLSQNTRDEVTIVMAIIDDKNNGTTFMKQQLWGLAETKRLVERQGFKFNITTIPSKKEIDDSVIIKKETSQVAKSEDIEEDEIHSPDAKEVLLKDILPKSYDRGYVTDLLKILLDGTKATKAVTLEEVTKVKGPTISLIKKSPKKNDPGARKIWDFFCDQSRSEDEMMGVLKIKKENWKKFLNALKKVSSTAIENPVGVTKLKQGENDKEKEAPFINSNQDTSDNSPKIDALVGYNYDTLTISVRPDGEGLPICCTPLLNANKN